MKYKIICILLFLFLLNCTENTTEEKIIVFHSEGFDFDKRKEFDLVTQKSDSIIKYEYSFKNRNEFNIKMEYKFISKKLRFNLSEFFRMKKTVKIKSISEYPFYYFDNTDLSLSHVTEPLIFNEEYGLLSIGNSYAPNFIFLKNEKDTIHFKLIEQKLKEFYE